MAALGVAEHHVVLEHAAGQEPGRHPPLRASLAAYPRGEAGETGLWAATDIGGVYDTPAVAGVSKSAQRRWPATQQQPGWRGLGVEDSGTGRGTGQGTSTWRGPGRERRPRPTLARLPRQSSRRGSSRPAPRRSGMPGAAEFGPYPHAASWSRAIAIAAAHRGRAERGNRNGDADRRLPVRVIGCPRQRAEVQLVLNQAATAPGSGSGLDAGPIRASRRTSGCPPA